MGKGGKGAHHHHHRSRSSYSGGRNRGGFFFHHRGPSHSHITYRGHRSHHRFQVRAAVATAAGGTLTVGLMGRRSHRHRTHVGYVPQRPLMAGPMAYAALFRGLVDFVDHTEVDEVSEQRRWAIDCSGDDQNGTALQFHLWRRAHRYVAPDFYDAPAATTEPADDDAWRAELPPDGPNFAVVDIALIAKEPEAAADTLNDCGLGQKLGPPARQLIRDVAAACRGFYSRKTTKMVCCCFEVDDAAAVEDRNDDIEDAAVAALGRGAVLELPRDATVSFVRLGALLAVVFEIVPPAPTGVASFPPVEAAAAPRTFEVKPLVVGPVDMDGVVEGDASSSSSDDDDDDVTRRSSGWTALRQKYKGRASYVEGESADYVATAPAYPTVTVCVVKISRRVRAESSRRPPHALDALVDFHTGNRRGRAGRLSARLVVDRPAAAARRGGAARGPRDRERRPRRVRAAVLPGALAGDGARRELCTNQISRRLLMASLFDLRTGQRHDPEPLRRRRSPRLRGLHIHGAAGRVTGHILRRPRPDRRAHSGDLPAGDRARLQHLRPRARRVGSHRHLGRLHTIVAEWGSAAAALPGARRPRDRRWRGRAGTGPRRARPGLGRVEV